MKKYSSRVMLFFLFALLLKPFAVSTNAQLSGKSHGTEMKASAGNEIRMLLKKIKVDLQLDNANLGRLLELFKNNECGKNNDFFSQRGDDELFYETINYLKVKPDLNIDYFRFIIKLSLVIKKSVEINEFLSEVIPELALLNINNFVKVYGELEPPERQILITDMENLKGPAQYKLLKKNLDSVSNDLTKTAQEIKHKTESYLLSE